MTRITSSPQNMVGTRSTRVPNRASVHTDRNNRSHLAHSSFFRPSRIAPNYPNTVWTIQKSQIPRISQKNSAVAKYALEGLPNKIMASEYKLVLPNEKLLASEIDKARESIQRRRAP